MKSLNDLLTHISTIDKSYDNDDILVMITYSNKHIYTMFGKKENHIQSIVEAMKRNKDIRNCIMKCVKEDMENEKRVEELLGD